MPYIYSPKSVPSIHQSVFQISNIGRRQGLPSMGKQRNVIEHMLNAVLIQDLQTFRFRTFWYRQVFFGCLHQKL